MSLGALLRKHVGLVQLILDFFLAISVAVYANLLTLHQFKYREVGYWNLLVLGFGLIVLLRYRITRQFSIKTQRRVAENILQAAARTLALPKRGGENSFRAACHLYDARHKELKHFCHWSSFWHADWDQSIPCNHPRSEKFVIVRAFKYRAPEAKNLEDDERSNLLVPVWSGIKSVIAAPIRDFNNPDPEAEPLGTISFDSSLTLQQARLDTDQAKEICRIYASSLYELMK